MSSELGQLFSAGPASVDWERVAQESPPLFMLAKDITERGLQEPIVVTKDGKVADGIHRMFVLWLLGHQGKVPTKVME